MNETIAVSIISLIGTFGGTIGGILAANKLTNYRIEQLEKKVEKHNNVIDRVYRLEGRADVINEEMKVANHRIQDLEKLQEKGDKNEN